METTTAVTSRAEANALRGRVMSELRRELAAIRDTAEDNNDDEMRERVARLEGSIAQIDQELTRLADRSYLATVSRDENGLLVSLMIRPTT